jgi:phosphocarrier protein
MTSRSVVVSNELGLHARAAARFVHLATQFTSQIKIGRDSRMMDGKSIMGILLLAAARGTLLTITAHGPDEAAALEALVALVESGFGESSTLPGPGETWNA